jgi:hypothetical protein
MVLSLCWDGVVLRPNAFLYEQQGFPQSHKEHKEVNEEKKELLLTLFPLSNQRSNDAIKKYHSCNKAKSGNLIFFVRKKPYLCIEIELFKQYHEIVIFYHCVVDFFLATATFSKARICSGDTWRSRRHGSCGERPCNSCSLLCRA